MSLFLLALLLLFFILVQVEDCQALIQIRKGLAAASSPGGRTGAPPSSSSSSSSKPWFLQVQRPRRLKAFVSAELESTRIAAGGGNDDQVDFDWKSIAYNVFEKDSRPILLFDGHCNFCNGGVTRCLDWDQVPGLDDDEQMKRYNFRYASLQSRVGQSLLLQHGKAADDLSSLVLVSSPEKAHFESDAVLRIAAKLPGLPLAVRTASFLARKLVPRFIRDTAYHFIADNRYWFGESKEEDAMLCRVDLGHLTNRFVTDPDAADCPDLLD